MHNINATKERILSIIEQKGPSFPVQIARLINVSPLFTSVFLSELKEDNKLRTSHMRLGSSPLFYIQGQEALLENFTEYLNQREKEAFFLIKKAQVLEDDKQLPVIRVALKAIKDFATPIRITANNIDKIFWRYHLLEEAEFDNRIRRVLDPSAEIPSPRIEKIPERIIEKPTETILSESKAETTTAKFESPILLERKTQIEENVQTIKKTIETPKSQKTKVQAPSEFAEKVKEYLASKRIEILSSIIEKKKEFMAKIKANTLFGEQEYYLVAKDKKKINETDITLALQKAQTEKMIAIILSPGELDKKAIPHLTEWKNLVKFEKIEI